MNITTEQFENAARGMPVDIEVDNLRFVLIRRDMFEQLSNDSQKAFDPEFTYPAILEAWDSVGSPDDATDYLLDTT